MQDAPSLFLLESVRLFARFVPGRFALHVSRKCQALLVLNALDMFRRRARFATAANRQGAIHGRKLCVANVVAELKNNVSYFLSKPSLQWEGLQK